MGGITKIVDFAVHHWRMTLAFLALSVIGGVIAMFNIPLDDQPDVDVPFLNVQVVLPGVSPEDSERLLVKPLETELKSLDGVKVLSGLATTSRGAAIVEFNADFNAETALSDVLEAVDKARGELPEDAKEPVVEEINTQTMPVVVINLFGDVPERALQSRAKALQSRLEANPKILEANIFGEREELLEAVIDPGAMESYGITFNELAGAISRNNALVAAGNIETASGKFAVKLPGLIVNATDLEDIVVRAAPDGSIVKMGDIAQVRRTYKDRTSFARFQGQPSVSIEVSKRVGENIIDTVDDVKVIVEQTTENWPKNIRVELSQDQTSNIISLIRSLTASILNAVVLVFIVCVAALGLRSALMVGFAIPSSFLVTLFILDSQGASINMMNMFAMVLSVGILVDSAIVIVEYADRKIAEGLDRKAAYILAGNRMFWPIVSSTGTTLAAFIPLLFWNTIEGQFMAYLPRTLLYVLTASMFMALIFLPTVGALFGPKAARNPRESLRALSAAEGDPMSIQGFTGKYARLIDKLARRPFLVLLGSLLIVGGILAIFTSKQHTVEFFTETAGDEIYIYARARGNLTPMTQLEIAQQVEAQLYDLPGIQSIFSVAGEGIAGGGFGLQGNPPVDSVSRTFVELVPFEERAAASDIVKEIRQRIANVPGLLIDIEVVAFGPPIGKDLAIELRSDDLDALRVATQRLTAHMDGVPALADIENTLPLPGVEWQLAIDRAEAGRLGLDVNAVGAAVQFVTEGSLVGFFRPIDSDEELDIRIRYPDQYRDLQNLESLRILTKDGALPLSSVVSKTPKTRVDSINRRDQSRYFEVRANVREGYAPNQETTALKDWMATEMDLPDSVEYKFLGQDEESQEAQDFFTKAGIATLFMMAIILLWQFNSFWQVFLTLSAVVFSVFGVLLGWMFSPYISIMLGGVGILALAGIVVNNNIVLIDTFKRLRVHGFSAHDAAVRTAAQRMRPVFLTTITTMVGLMPMALGWHADLLTGDFSSSGAETSSVWQPISYVIIVGLGFSTLLTLIITPVFLAAPNLWYSQVLELRAKFKDGNFRFWENEAEFDEQLGE